MATNFSSSRTLAALALAVGLGLAAAQSAARADTAVGTWRLSSGKITVRVDNCGANLCATVVGLSKPLNKEGKPKVDKENPNPALRNRPVIGLRVVDGMAPAGENKWSGKIYNADDGKTYSGTAEVSGDTLVIKACILGGLACKKQRFARVN